MASICKRKDGTWCAAVVVGTKPNGKHNRKYLYGKTKKEVEEKVRKFTTDIYNFGQALDESKITFAEWSYKHLFINLKNSIAKTTFDTYMGIYEVHIKREYIGDMDMKNIKQLTMQDYFNNKNHLSTEMIKKIYNVLNSSFKGAIANNIIRMNPLKEVKLPKSTRKEVEIEVFTRDEQKKYILEADNETYGLLCTTSLFTGLRLGEITALRWEHVNLKVGEITVAESAKYTRVFDKEGDYKKQYVVKEPKSTSGFRHIPIPSFVLVKLKEYKLSSAYKDDNDKVFCTKSGNFVGASNIRRSHARICSRAGINNIHFHALRHTFATRMVESGINFKTLQYLMGHSDIKVTLNRYSHVVEQTKREAIATQEKFYKELML